MLPHQMPATSAVAWLEAHAVEKARLDQELAQHQLEQYAADNLLPPPPARGAWSASSADKTLIKSCDEHHRAFNDLFSQIGSEVSLEQNRADFGDSQLPTPGTEAMAALNARELAVHPAAPGGGQC